MWLQGLEGAEVRWPRQSSSALDMDETPFMEIDLPNEEAARAIAARAVGIKGVFEPWGHGSTAEECLQDVANFPDARKAPYLQQGSTFKINVCTYGYTLGEEARLKRIQETFKHVDFKGKVLMDRTRKGVRQNCGPRAENQFWWFEDVGVLHSATLSKAEGAAAAAAAPHHLWFCREVAIGQRALLDRYDLRKREYLCSTCSPPPLSPHPTPTNPYPVPSHPAPPQHRHLPPAQSAVVEPTRFASARRRARRARTRG